MKVLLVGSGGREHALAWKLSASERCDVLYCAPGNAGIEECAECVAIAAEDVDGLVKFAKEKKIDLVVVGPEVPLVKGLADKLKEAKIKVFVIRSVPQTLLAACPVAQDYATESVTINLGIG